jgi:hypothetical protein
MPTTTPTRRSALRGISLTAIAAGMSVPVLASAAPDDGADAELLRLCAEASDWEDLLRQIDAHGTSDEKCKAATDDWDGVFRQIAETRATTMAGMRAKAKVLYLAITREAANDGFYDYMENPEGVREHLYPDGLIAWSLAADVLAVGGAS